MCSVRRLPFASCWKGALERERFAFPLWYMGYQIGTQQLRVEVLRHMERLKRLHRKKLRGASGKEEAEDALDFLSRMLAKAAATTPGLDNLQPLATEFIGALLNTWYKVDASEVWELEITAAEYLKANYTFPDGEPLITNDSLVAALNFTRLNVSFNSVLCLLSSVTDRELEVAHRRWRSVIGIIGVLVPGPSAELAEEGRRIAAILGAFFVLALLLLERNRKGRFVDFWIKKLEREAENTAYTQAGHKALALKPKRDPALAA